MIHRLSVSNYHSVREEVVLDLRIPGTAPDLPCFRRSAARPDVRLPAVAVLMGPNGSGKTTLLRALVIAADIASTAPLTEPRELVPSFPSCPSMEEAHQHGFASSSKWVDCCPTGHRSCSDTN